MTRKLLDEARRALAKGARDTSSFDNLNPDEQESVALCNALGDLYGRAKNPQRAYDFYQRAAILYRDDGYNTKAIAILRKAGRLVDPPRDVFWELAELYLSEGLKAEASSQFLRYAQASLGMGDNGGLMLASEQIATLDPNNARIRTLLAELYEKSGQLSRAIEEYQEAESLWQKSGDPDQAEQIAGKLKELDGSEEKPVADGKTESEDEDKDEDLVLTVEDTDEFEVILPETKDLTPEEVSKLNEQKGSLDTVMNEFKEAMSSLADGDDPSGHYDLGIAYKEMGMMEEAISEFQAAATFREFRTKAASLLADCFIEKGLIPLALKELERAVDAATKDDERLILHYRLGLLYLESHKKKQAKEHLLECYAIDVSYYDVSTRLKKLGAL